MEKKIGSIAKSIMGKKIGRIRKALTRSIYYQTTHKLSYPRKAIAKIMPK